MLFGLPVMKQHKSLSLIGVILIKLASYCFLKHLARHKLNSCCVHQFIVLGFYIIDQHKVVHTCDSAGKGNMLFLKFFTNENLKSIAYVFVEPPFLECP